MQEHEQVIRSFYESANYLALDEENNIISFIAPWDGSYTEITKNLLHEELHLKRPPHFPILALIRQGDVGEPPKVILFN